MLIDIGLYKDFNGIPKSKRVAYSQNKQPFFKCARQEDVLEQLSNVEL